TLADGRCESTTNDRADAIRNRHAREANVGREKLGVPGCLWAERQAQTDCEEAQTSRYLEWLCGVDHGERWEREDNQPVVAEQVGVAAAEVVRDNAAN